MLVKFDQDKLVEKVADKLGQTEKEKEMMKDRKYGKLLKWGYVYYPNKCVDKLKTKQCMF